MVFDDRPHQRRLRAHGVFRVDVGAPVEQQGDGLDLAGTGRGHQRGFAAGSRSVGIGAGVEQAGGGSPALPFIAARCDRRDSVSRRGLHVRAGFDQRTGSGEVVAPNGPVQRGGAIGLRRVDCLAIGRQGAESVLFSSHDRVGQLSADARGRCGDHPKQQQPAD